MKKNVFNVIAVLCALLCSACTKPDNPAEQRAVHLKKSKGPIVIAAAAPWSSNRNMLYNGIELACKQINNNGGIMNRQLVIKYFDDFNDEAAGQMVAYNIASDKDICAVLGHSASAVSEPNALLYHYYGLLMFSPLSTGTGLTEQGFNKVFRNIPNDGVLGQEAARFCAKMGWNNVVVYYNLDTYGESLSNAFERQCTLMSVDVLDRSAYSASMHKNDFEETVQFWKRNYTFDAVFIAGIFPVAGDIITTIRENGISCPIIGGEAFDHPAMFTLDESVANNVYAVTMYDADSLYQPYVDFKNQFYAEYSLQPDMAALQGYDAVTVLASAYEQAQSIVPDVVAHVIRSMSAWNGAAGPYGFAENGDILGKKVVTKKVVNNAFVVVNK